MLEKKKEWTRTQIALSCSQLHPLICQYSVVCFVKAADAEWLSTFLLAASGLDLT